MCACMQVLHFMQMADVIGSMHELFHACKDGNVSPLQALQVGGRARGRGLHMCAPAPTYACMHPTAA